MSAYEPGTVAVATVNGITNVRPLVVLDLEAAPFDFDGRATPEKFLRAVAEHARQRACSEDPPNVRFAEWLADQIEAQTRPAITEPTGLGAVVEDAEGDRWVRDPAGSWHSEHEVQWWSDLRPVRVLSEGVA